MSDEPCIGYGVYFLGSNAIEVAADGGPLTLSEAERRQRRYGGGHIVKIFPASGDRTVLRVKVSVEDAA